jgi:beta-glucosidase
MLKLITLSFLISRSSSQSAPWQNASLPLDERVSNLVSLMRLEEKVSNLYSNAAPGALRLGLGPYRYDEECMRGAVTSGVSARPLGTGFPTLLALAGTFNVSLLAAVAEVGAREVRAYYNIDRRTKGLVTTANCYAPVSNLVRDPRWGRNAEMAIGEDPVLGRVIARAWTAAMRGSASGDSETSKLVTSVCKHIATYGGPENFGGSRFSFNAELDERTWREYFLPAFRGSAEGGADAFMCSYSSVTLTDAPEKLSMTPDCASPYMLNTIVRGEWNWTGFVTSDANAVANIFTEHHFVNSTSAAAIAALVGGCDMELTCCGSSPVSPSLVQSVRSGLVNESVVNTALARVLRARFATGDLDPPASSPWAGLNESDIYAPSSLALAREAARQSVVLLSNSVPSAGGLPWTRATLAGKQFCVVGPLANATQDFMGGYTSVPRPGDIISPLVAFSSALAGVASVALVPGCAPGDGVVCAALQLGLSASLASCDAIALVVGTSAYAKIAKINLAREGEGKDRTAAVLAGQQGALLAAARSAGKPLVVVVVSGGMVDIGDSVDGVSAIIAAPFAGQFAGDAIAAIILGDENPAGRLTTTWYTAQAFAAIGDLTNYSMAARTYRNAAPGAARWPFGHGLSFSSFSYSNLHVFPAAPGPCDTLNVTVTLTNAAGPAGVEVAQLFTSFPGASVPAQPVKSLVNWERMFVPAGGATTLSLTISPEDNAVLREGDFVPVIEPGARGVWLGSSSDSSSGTPGIQGSYTVTGAVTPLAECGAAQGTPRERPAGVAHVWPKPPLGRGGGAARWTK